ncbi:hypothetical protein [Metamycoplasma hominis]|nr:hypothetical protein [Metamycoplasma hominis]
MENEKACKNKSLEIIDNFLSNLEDHEKTQLKQIQLKCANTI